MSGERGEILHLKGFGWLKEQMKLIVKLETVIYVRDCNGRVLLCRCYGHSIFIYCLFNIECYQEGGHCHLDLQDVSIY